MNKKPTFEKFTVIEFNFVGNSIVKILLSHTTNTRHCCVTFPFFENRKEIVCEFLKDSSKNKRSYTLNYFYKFLNFEV